MLFSSLKNKPIFNLDGAEIGKINKVVIDYATGKISGLATGSIFEFKEKQSIISGIIIKGNKIILKDKQNFIEVRQNDKKGSIIGIKVYTESGTYLGKVKDFEINEYLWRLSQIFVSKQLSSKSPLIIADDQIISISFEKIIVRDLVIEDAIPNLA